MNTHYVESFNNVALVYLDKRVHYHDLMYKIRIGLAVCDWNENVDRPATSVRQRIVPGQPHNHTTYRVLFPKTFRFVDDIWREFVEEIMQDMGQGIGQDNNEAELHGDVLDVQIDNDSDDDYNNYEGDE